MLRRDSLIAALSFVAAAAMAGLVARDLPLPTHGELRPAAGARRADASPGTLAEGADLARDSSAGDASLAGGDASSRRGGARARGGRGEGDVLRRIAAGAPGTYIGEILRGRDSSLARWPERVERPLAVWIQPGANVPGWRPEFVDRAREAFTEWAGTGIPLRFTFDADSARADVHLTWVDRFSEKISGKTIWTRDDRWWIVSADVVLALHHHDGAPLDGPAVRAIALHEIGHLVGLDHTSGAGDIMTPRVRVRSLSPADAATARLLYTLPPGRVR